MGDNTIDSKSRTDVDPSRWDPPPPVPKDARAERVHADAVHADRIDNLPWHPQTCDFENMDHVAACTTAAVADDANDFTFALYRAATREGADLAMKLDTSAIVAGGAPKIQMEFLGLDTKHTYSVDRIYEKNGTTFVELRNPWGDNSNPQPIPLTDLQGLRPRAEIGQMP